MPEQPRTEPPRVPSDEYLRELESRIAQDPEYHRVIDDARRRAQKRRKVS